MQIKPIIHVDNEGHLINVGKARGRKAAMETLVKKLNELGKGYDNHTVFITHGDCLEEAQALADKLSTMIFNFHVKSGSEGKVFGSVSTKQIVEELARQDIKVDKKKFIDTTPITSLGVTKVRVDLYRGVIATIACNLIGSE